MLFSQTEIDYEHLLKVLAQNKVRSFYVPVNEVSVMDLLNGLKHLNEELHRNFKAVIDLENLPYFGQIVSKQIHDDQILFRVLYEIVDIAHMFESFQAQ